MRIARRVALVVVVIGVAARAATLAPGTALPPLALTDQHDVAAAIGPETRVILFTRDMDAGDVAKEALAEQAALLAAAHAVYVADISGMPSLIARLFALPAMRKRPYRMLLDRDGRATADFPSRAGEVTMLRLGNGTIERIEFHASAAALRAALASAATPAP
jgi:NADPH-dependent ferric siderophore reductase